MSEVDTKKLCELRVVDLKAELEKRDLDTTGVKAVLVKKLKEAMSGEGLDPETYAFTVDSKGSPVKTKKKEENITEEETNKDTSSEKLSELDKTNSEDASKQKEVAVIKTDNVDVADAQLEEVKPCDTNKQEELLKDDKPSTKIREDPIKEELEKEELVYDDLKDEDKVEDKDEYCEEEADEASKPGQATSEKDPEEEEKLELQEKNDVNGMDTEDSIHLTIGEDEEKLMAGEDDVVDKKKEMKDCGRSGNKKQESRKDARNVSPEKSSDEKAKKSTHRNLWVSGLSSVTRATDLKHVFSKVGKVVAAKVVTNAKTPGARCYGFVTMATTEDAQSAIRDLNCTELHGRLISVEAVANKPKNAGTKKPEEKSLTAPSPRRSEERKRKKEDSAIPSGTDQGRENGGTEEKTESIGGGRTSSVGETGACTTSEGRRSTERRRSTDRRHTSSRDRHRAPRHHSGSESGILSFSQIKEERERQRLREKERALREEDRRRREERERHRIIEKKQRDEALRLEREREKIRIEMARLEKERAELLRMERDRLQREKEDLKRQQLNYFRLEEERRSKRTLSSSRDSYEDRKRQATERRYESAHGPSRDYKKESARRDDGISPPSGRVRYGDSPPASSSRTSRREETSRMKDSMRYSDRPTGTSSSSYRSRDERDRREEGSHRKSESSRMSHRDRYDPTTKSVHRYGVESWAGSSSANNKEFSSVVTGGSGREPPPPAWNGMPGDRKAPPDMNPWARAPPERWASSGSGGSSSMVGSGGGSRGVYPPPMVSNMPMQMSGGPLSYQTSGDRFDAYKPINSMSRKY
ncbi:scaffold attachment factor B2 isoform X2 [Cimex lectularius]|uniref:Scaffold attachment factor B n=1 Tax=Cimex lectularius TaxID=79782 RepID=A0A8I6SNQ0_CIMLE|nr:scaffold attachment factor B2 isoform X2 [Cimex lectularius]